MTATNHAITGALIAVVIKNPYLALPLALASHFALDVIPHGEPRDFRRLIAKAIIFGDCLIAGVVSVILSLTLNSAVSPWLIFGCMSLAVVPDLIWGIRYIRIKDLDKTFTEPMSKFSKMHINIQGRQFIKGFYIETIWLMAVTTSLIYCANI